MSPAGIDTAVVLCGGRGTRLQEHTQAIPKPLVEVGGLPIVWHVVSILAAQGVERVLLLTGYRSELVAAFAAAADWPGDVRVECVDTGPDTPTAGHSTRSPGCSARTATSRPTVTASQMSTSQRSHGPTSRRRLSRR